MYVNTQRKYRPKNLSEYIFADNELEDIVYSYVNGCQTRPLILFGSYGTGKSLLADLIPKAIDGDEAQIEKLKSNQLNSEREVYKQFLRSKQFDSLFKFNDKFNYFIIEEVNFDPKAKGALRTILDEYEGTDLVIITTNEVHKIDAAIRSRSNVIEVKPLKPEQFFNKAMDIISSEGMSVDQNLLLQMLEHVYIHNCDNRAYYKELDNILLNA